MDNQNRNDQKAFYSSSPSRHKEDKKQSIRIGILIPVILLAAVLLFFLVRMMLDAGKNKPETTGAAQSGESMSRNGTETSGSQMATLPYMPVIIGTKEETQEETQPVQPSDTQPIPPETTGAVLPTQPTTAETPTAPPVTKPFHLYTAEELLPLPDDIDRGLFKDVNAADTHGSWWFGSMVRDLSTGKVTAGYDRSAATKDLLAK